MCKYIHDTVRKRIHEEAMVLVCAVDDAVFMISLLCYSYVPIAFSPIWLATEKCW